MKIRLTNLCRVSCLLLILLACVPESRAQQASPPRVGCIDAQVRLRADEIKKHFTGQGLEVFRDAMIGMESQMPYPILVDLQAGQLYQIIFVAHPESTRQFLNIYDRNEKKLHSVSHNYGLQQPYYITFTFTPPATDTYAFVVEQKWKRKEMCGSFTILRAKKGAAAVQLTPYESN